MSHNSKMRSLPKMKQTKSMEGPCSEKVSRFFRMGSGDRPTVGETEWNGVAEKEAKKAKIVVCIRAAVLLAVGIGANDSSYRSRE